MKMYRLIAEVKDDICLSSKQDYQNIYQSLGYIPGRIVWGAMASLTGIKPGTIPDYPNFMKIFYSDNIIFSNLYPADTKYVTDITDLNFRTKPTPLSARAEKIAPGFTNDFTNDGRGKGIQDWLINKPDPNKILFEDFIKYEEFYYNNPPDCETFSQSFNQITQHERNVNSGTTKEGMLFSRITIPRGSCFLGYISCNLKTLENDLEKFLNNNNLFYGIEMPIGRAPGRIFFKIDNNLDSIKKEEITPASLKDAKLFTITCYSDIIIMDKYHRYLSCIPDSLINELLKDINVSCKLENHFSSTKILQGWNGAYRRPSEEEIAISAGSAFSYLFTDKINDYTLLAGALDDLQNKGIGLKRSQGFGEIKINDLFHRQGRSI